MLTSLYPAIEPFQAGHLVTPDGEHHIYYEQCGNPNGAPVVVLHGGPGSGCNPGQRRFFDPSYYRIILFDQRGSGRSRPAGQTACNDTPLLVEDIELLRHHLGLPQWMVFGGSWGSTLAMAYASRHSASISRMILRGIFLARPHELDWFINGVNRFFPDAWERFTNALDTYEKQDILTSYAKRILDNNHPRQLLAAKAWSEYETSIMTLLPPPEPSTLPDDESMLTRLKVHMHYLTHNCFLDDAPLLGQIDRFRHIPATIIHGRYDMVCPISTAYKLHQAWPEAEFIVVDGAGHSAMEPGIAAALVNVTNHYKNGA